jgi:RNA methyltransferase, TrmH family
MKEILSLQHPLVKHLVKLRQNTDYRYDHHAIVIEGLKMVAEAAQFQKFKTLLTTSPEFVPADVKADEIILTTPAILQKISGLQSPEGILAEAPMPEPSDFKGKKHLIALDGINDPGNLGTILRTALALGWEGVFFLNEGCDPYNEKALRASRGAVFRLPMAHGNWDDLQKIVKQNQLTAFVADTDGTPFDQINPSNGIMLVLGNEATGPSKETLSHCTAVTIPMPGKMESLNVAVAAGILLYTLGAPKK